MKKLFLPFLTVFALGFVTSCSDDDDPTPDPGDGGEELVKQGILTENETWTADNIYILDGRVVVDEGVTLTIEPGTIIKAEDGQEANASALIVDQGGRLLANGTATQPIIFTSVNDGIQPGETESTLDVEDSGQWGGVILLGRAPISFDASSGEAIIEGIPGGLSYGNYGGDNPTDNSGSLQYISIRFSGVALAPDSEIQGLTLGGVGSGTVIRNIEIYSNNDDGVEWFGGTVNVENLLVYGQQDDGIDIDQAYSGTISNAYVIQTASSGSAFEIDGPEGSATGSFTLRNITVDAGNFAGKLLADFRDGAMGTLENIYIFNIAGESTINIADAATVTTYNSGEIVFNSWELVLPESAELADLFTSAVDGVSNTAFVTNATGVAAGEASVGADLSVFNWTYTKSQGVF
ncbi:right-handed parallel beta-helix repeat-containing protein [Parapedobacter koreensis]|uniref:Right handed beta helix region n=1 Tax=Parapedobacter koreensis TaxID=332977 RepID=A0A1H7LA58_9SPHI|nr:right-handed parallel beta-helix repeat-containing protein [Parapedobacter koreensis]SEK95247.1 hypothetical protein SAMN05421740_10375 [Parapedobacter koreensis]